MTRLCPKCERGTLIELQDIDSDIQEWVCPLCAYYDSNSEAFTLHPWMFADLGTEILAEIKQQLAAKGLTEKESQTWLEQEPSFNKAIVEPLPTKRRFTDPPAKQGLDRDRALVLLTCRL